MLQNQSKAALCLLFVFLLIPAFCVADPQAAAPSKDEELLASGHVDELVPVLQQRISQSPRNAVAQNLLCRAYFMMEDWDRGISACEQAVYLDPQNSKYSLWLGRVNGEKADRSSFVSAPGLAKKARESFERAVELDQKNVEARLDLGEFYAEAPGIIGGGRDKAYRQADLIMPLSAPMGHWLLARIAEKEKDPAKAEREYRAEIAATNGSVRGWLDLANFLMYAHRYDEMEQALNHQEIALIDHPDSLMFGANLLLRSRRDYPLAVRLMRRYLGGRLVEDAPAFKAHTILGEILEKQGDRQGATQEFRAALALFQDYSRAKDDLKRLAH